MGNFLRIAGIIVFIALIAVAFLAVHDHRDDAAISTAELVIRGWVPVILGFALAWGAAELADRIDSRPCPQCGRRVPLGSYRCRNCGFDLRRETVPQT